MISSLNRLILAQNQAFLSDFLLVKFSTIFVLSSNCLCYSYLIQPSQKFFFLKKMYIIGVVCDCISCYQVRMFAIIMGGNEEK